MSELDTLTSAGMRALQKVYQIFTPREERPNAAHLKLCSAPPQIYNVLGITGFGSRIAMGGWIYMLLGPLGAWWSVRRERQWNRLAAADRAL